MLLQKYLFQQALKEHGIDFDSQTDHKNGINIVGSLKFGIKYPISYLQQIKDLDHSKVYDYSFIGAITKTGGREKMLEKYVSERSLIRHSTNGRNADTKYNFDVEYYQTICNSKFSLCPIHVGDFYRGDNGWTYRFVESLFCKSIPIVFRDSPIGKNFLKDIKFYWDDETHPNTDYETIVEDNYNKAVAHWTLSAEEVETIKQLI